jgi:predicted anti-sigma-YlaC factor YlaD
MKEQEAKRESLRLRVGGMNCKKIQEVIITDYIDEQMTNKAKSLIDQHLARCTACAGYLSSIRKAAVNPFANVSKEIPDQVLWVRIKQTIEEEQQYQLEASLKPNFWERLRLGVHIPRPAFALATVVTMIFIIGSTGQLFFSAPVVNINGQDQVAYLSSLIDDPVDMNNGNDSQTPIEKVFL